MPCRYASSAPSAPSTGVQTLPQPRRDAMVIGERYVADRRWKAGWRSSHGEKCNRAITGTRLRKTMESERRGEMSRQGAGAEVPGPSSIPTTRVTGRKTHDPPPLLLPKTCVAYVYGISTRDCTCPEVAAPAPGTCPERREMESPFRKDDDANVEAFIRAPFQLLPLACPSSGSTTREEWKDWGSAHKRDSSSHLEPASRSSHAVRQKFAFRFRSGSWLWVVLLVTPPPQRPPGSAAGGLGRVNLAIRRRQPTARFHDICFGGGIRRVRGGN